MATTGVTARDGWVKVTGAAQYTSDIAAPGALHAAFVLSTEAHARIVAIDTTAAKAVPGVAAVLTGADIGPRRVGRAMRDYPVLAVDRVLFIGQRVVAVAAEDRETAELAAGLVEVHYEPLEVVPHAAASLASTWDSLHPEFGSYLGAPETPRGANVQGGITRGDGVALTDCDVVIDTTFFAGRSHAAPIEPHTCLVAAGSTVHVYSAHKEPFTLRSHLAEVSGRDPEEIVVHVTQIGGDFGSKGFPFVEPACYFLSEATGRPVRTTMSYHEELTSTSARHPAVMRLRTGVRDGALHALQSETVLDGGAFAGIKPIPMLIVPVVGVPYASYDVPNRAEKAMCVYSNSLPGGHVRSPGEFQAHFAGESQVDMVARAVGRDPLEFRMAHALNRNVRAVLEETIPVVEKWRTDLPSDSGVGVALCFRDFGPGETTVLLRAERGAGVTLFVNVPDQGSGSYALLRRLVAERLGLAESRVAVEAVATDRGLADHGAGASRVSVVVGGAAQDACDHLLEVLGVAPGSGEWLDDCLERQGRTSIEAPGRFTWASPPPPDSKVRSYGAVAVQVHVDRETGQVVPERALVVADTGRVLNPVAHRGQIEGGFVYGLSQTLLEELLVEDGQVVTASLGDYKIASIGDVPPLEVRLVPPERTDGVEGIRSVGELVNVGVAPAVANAVDHAVGARVLELPITPERVLRALGAI